MGLSGAVIGRRCAPGAAVPFAEEFVNFGDATAWLDDAGTPDGSVAYVRQPANIAPGAVLQKKDGFWRAIGTVDFALLNGSDLDSLFTILDGGGAPTWVAQGLSFPGGLNGAYRTSALGRFSAEHHRIDAEWITTPAGTSWQDASELCTGLAPQADLGNGTIFAGGLRFNSSRFRNVALLGDINAPTRDLGQTTGSEGDVTALVDGVTFNEQTRFSRGSSSGVYLAGYAISAPDRTYGRYDQSSVAGVSDTCVGSTDCDLYVRNTMTASLNLARAMILRRITISTPATITPFPVP